MSTATLNGCPPAAFSHDPVSHAAQRAQRLQKLRWVKWLTAKDLLIDRVSRARRFGSAVLRRYGLQRAALTMRRVFGWAVTAAQRTLRTTGPLGWLSAVGLAASSGHVRAAVGAVVRAVSSVARRAAQWGGRLLTGFLGLFGVRGRSWAQSLSAAAGKLQQRVSRTLRPVLTVGAQLLRPSSPPMIALGTWSRERVVSRTLHALLPGGWALAARLVSMGLLMPASVRRSITDSVVSSAAQVYAGLSVDRENLLRATAASGTDRPARAASATAPADGAGGVAGTSGELAELPTRLTLSVKDYPAKKRSAHAKRT